MKRSDAIYKLSEKLQKQNALVDGYKKGSINLKCLCDNLSIIIMNEIETIGMLPPIEPEHENDYTYPNIPDWERE